MTILQDIIHCEDHCMALKKDDWVCKLEEHADHHTKGCFFGTEFEISDEDFASLPED